MGYLWSSLLAIFYLVIWASDHKFASNIFTKMLSNNNFNDTNFFLSVSIKEIKIGVPSKQVDNKSS